VYTAVHDGVTGGRSLKTIADEIMDQTGVHRNKAKFWARDQVSKFFGEATKQRQVQAGIKGYIWRTDPGARDSHSALEGTYQEWSKPPQIYRTGKGGLSLVRVHPGEDFNCRCFAEPATGPEMGERNYRGPGSFSEELQPGYFSERAQSVPMQWSGTGGLRERMAVDIQDPVLRRSVDDAVRTVDRVMTIPTASTRALSVTQLKPGDVLYNAPVNGYYLRGHVSLQTQNPFQRMTAIHELYHWVHQKLLPAGAKGPLQSVINVIHRTSAYTQLQRGIKVIKNRELRNRLIRYSSDDELFARTMEQYIARSTKDPSIINEFNEKRKVMKYGYWVDNEFDDIYIILETLFRNMGWQK
jgi:SPP1 gp7 family putative phage head morphogenesis protein